MHVSPDFTAVGGVKIVAELQCIIIMIMPSWFYCEEPGLTCTLGLVMNMKFQNILHNKGKHGDMAGFCMSCIVLC